MPDQYACSEHQTQKYKPARTFGQRLACLAFSLRFLLGVWQDFIHQPGRIARLPLLDRARWKSSLCENASDRKHAFGATIPVSLRLESYPSSHHGLCQSAVGPDYKPVRARRQFHNQVLHTASPPNSSRKFGKKLAISRLMIEKCTSNRSALCCVSTSSACS